MQYPTELSSITPEWLTSVLSGKLFEKDETVIEFNSKRLGEAQGFMSEIYQLTLTLSSSKTATLIAKLPNSLGRAIGSQFGYFTAEVFFYSYYSVDSGRKSPISMPKCYYAASDVLFDIPSADGGKPNLSNFCLLMEDCFPAEVGDQVKGLSVEEIEKALIQIAKFHAAWWKPTEKQLEDPQIKPFVSNKPLVQAWAPLVKLNYSLFNQYLEKYLYPNGCHPIVKQVGDMLHNVFANGQSLGEKYTVIHGDYRPDNMLVLRQTVDGDRNIEDFYAIDFQGLHLGNPMEDVSYLLSCGLTPNDLKENQDHLLKLYYNTLISSAEEIGKGPINYSFEQAKEDYREWLLYTFVLPILTAASLVKQMETDSAKMTDHQQRARSLMEAWIQRITEALILNDPSDILPDIEKRHLSACIKADVNPLDEKLDADYKGVIAYMNTILPEVNWDNYEVSKSRAGIAGFAAMLEEQKKTNTYDQVGELIEIDLKLEGEITIPVRIYHPTDEQKANATSEKNRIGLFFHNGWVNGQGKGRMDDLNLRKYVANSGRSIIAFDHRLAPEFSHSDVVSDCCALFNWIVVSKEGDEQRKELHLPVVDEVVLIGLQQGATLAAYVSLFAIHQNLSHFIAKQILLFPYIDPRCESESMKLFATRTRVLSRGNCLWSWKNFLQISIDDPLSSEKLEKFANDPSVCLLAFDDSTLSKFPNASIFVAEQSLLSDEVNSFVEKVRKAGGSIDLKVFNGVGDGFFIHLIAKGNEAINNIIEIFKN